MTERPNEPHPAGERSGPTTLAAPGPAGDPRRSRAAWHADGLQLTFVPGELVPGAGEFRLWGVADPARAAERLDLPPGEPAELPTVGVDGTTLVARDVPARGAALLPTVRRLAAMPPGSDWPAWSRPAPSVRGWSVAAKLALETVAAGQLLPAFRAASMLDSRMTAGSGQPASEPTPGAGQALWRAAPPTDGRLERLAAALPVAAHAVRRGTGELWSAEALLRAFLDAVADACAREGRRPVLDPRRRGPRQPWPQMWAAALTASDPTVVHLRAPAEEVAAEVDEWAAPLAGHDPGEAARLAVRLEPPPAGTARLEAPAGVWRLHFLLQSTQDPQARVTAAEVWQRAGSPLELAGARLESADAQLVRGLATAARLFAPIDRSLSLEQPTGVDLDVDEAADFLSEGAQALAAAGIGVQVPPELRDLDETRLRLRVRIGQDVPIAGRVRGIDEVSLRALTDARFEVALGDEPIESDELAEVVALDQPLVRWRGTWVRIDDAELDVLSELGGSTATLELTEALAAALSGQHRVADQGWVEATPDGRVAELVERLRASDAPGEAVITGIDGELRPYQKRAVAWLQRLTGLGMGGVLADEMGLGKTVQAIALLTSRPADRPSLVVCPTSVVGNWEREIRRFAPDLPVIRHHGPDRPDRRSAFRPGHVVLTSYALMRRDVAMLEDVAWDVVVLDEAQQIKNPSSKGARAARALEARARIAMTGTPIENRLAELWSIVDVTNAGLLGSQRAFNERFAVPIERWHDDTAATRLKRLTAPFVLRRRKDDPDVSVDLPPKQEVTVACALTREQAALYQRAIDEAFSGGGLGATAFERRGRILALLTRLKQVCNHPAHYLRDGSRLGERSGKLSRASEILGEIVASSDRALVFTQFREMGHLLVSHLGSELELPEVPFLHGGVPAPQRDRMVERFQEDDDAPPLLVISLRAGGTGLNLTRATEVVHYDRWWNPAVEDQATDRVHRIGQTRPVTVHRLVTAGTVEDRISSLLDRKRALADAVVGTGEAWITELDDDELAELVSLSTDDVADDVAEDDTVPARPHLVAVPDR